MNPPKKLTTQHQAEAKQETVSAEHTEQPSGLEFATPEELLRHDRLQTPVPPSIADRLEQSLDQAPPPPRSWWQRWFGRSNP